MFKYLKFVPRIVNRRGLPLHLIFFVTGRCNLKCEHCFYWKELNQGKKELSLDEIEQVSRSMGPLLWLALTGGEPFLRSDLPEIARIWVKNNRARHINIPTNGWFTDRVAALTEKMLAENRETFFSLTVSCDGIGSLHDQIRGVPGAFTRMTATVAALKKLKEKYRNLGVANTITFTATNQRRFLATYKYLRDKVKPDEIVFNLVRGIPKNPQTQKFDLRFYKEAVAQKQRDIRSGKLPYYQYGLVARIASASNRVMYDKIIKYQEGRRRYLPCQAARLSAVIDEAGVVFPCEILAKPLGKLRDYQLDFKKLWTSEPAESVRRWIWDNHCACTHECFLTTTIMFSPQTYTELLSYLLPGHSHGLS